MTKVLSTITFFAMPRSSAVVCGRRLTAVKMLSSLSELAASGAVLVVAGVAAARSDRVD